MNLENKNVNALRILAVDMIENAKSGHPGIALSSAPILYALYSKHLNVVPDDDKNIFRDRFVMSAGHGSSIYYATLHAFGFDLTLDDLKSFRKLDSITPGHPEYGLVPGVDATTGPLGQGVSTAVGMALAQKLMASKFNKPDITLFDNYTYALVGEGCLMEGVSFEALSLAGTLGLNKLIVLYDCNNVTLDASTQNVMNMDIKAYAESIGFNVIEVKDGNNVEDISNAISKAKMSSKPSFIKINTKIGFGSVYENSNKAHGSVLGQENVALLREKLNVSTQPFDLGKDVLRDFVFLRKRFTAIKKSFKDRLKAYSKHYPGDYKLLNQYLSNEFDFSSLNTLGISESMSGRDLGGLVLNTLASKNANIICASADVFGSTKAIQKDSGFINDNFGNNNLKCGIREFGMSTISNGIALYGGLVPVQSTFMVFSDYLKSALRLTALMNQKVITVLTHDSIAVGEDGATHQSCEQLWGLRNIPKTYVFRPANLKEVVASYVSALSYQGSSVLALSRQKLPEFECNIKDALMGGYIVAKENNGNINGIIIATGSELSLALDVKKILESKGYNIRVVSMPCVDIFDEQPQKYRDGIIPPSIKSVFSIEAGSTSGWYKYVGKFGKCFGVDEFGLSATPDDIYKKFKLTPEDISKEIIKVINANKE
ncbi:MAG: transketolase [Clostridia bacterium]|nr:transketolase [Clostridia bacterium]